LRRQQSAADGFLSRSSLVAVVAIVLPVAVAGVRQGSIELDDNELVGVRLTRHAAGAEGIVVVV
jgi:hypothetical protein